MRKIIEEFGIKTFFANSIVFSSSEMQLRLTMSFEHHGAPIWKKETLVVWFDVLFIED